MKRNIALLLVILMMFMITGITSFADAHDIDEFTLYAGQDMPVGTVEVSNDGDNIDVKYVLNDDALKDGWLISETHVHVGTKLEDFPLTEKGNPKVGLFDYTMEHAGVEDYEYSIPMGNFKPGDNLSIAAHAVVEKTECTINATAPYGGSEVIYSNQGLRYDYNPVSTVRSVHENALQYETGKDESNFFSLGFKNTTPSAIVIEFENPIMNGEGDDIKVVEDTWGLPYPEEKAEVYVSNDLEDWEHLGTANNQDQLEGIHTISNFNLPEGMVSAKYVKVVDATTRDGFNGRSSADGFDLNAVLSLHDNKTCETYSESAWASLEKELGEENRFVDKGNWATYFMYELTHGEEYIETVTVPSDGTTVFSIETLESGQEYRLDASGIFKYSNADYNQADAEYFEKSGGWIKGEIDPYSSIPTVLDVSIVGGPENDDWGGYNSDHKYSMDYTGNDSEVYFFIYDTNYNDNEGAITVDIFKIW